MKNGIYDEANGLLNISISAIRMVAGFVKAVNPAI